ncbi:uncharacterized protein LOC133858503 [Alnus glutinosa]|uniref:uncharacterized protein LOC133858503 n=1 Tax=Alnus glutinosa TaxID=3517 RepID=UPI002D777862|nr:uncharacterized protein LOC133858503 [Alnus glutinosa]
MKCATKIRESEVVLLNIKPAFKIHIQYKVPELHMFPIISQIYMGLILHRLNKLGTGRWSMIFHLSNVDDDGVPHHDHVDGVPHRAHVDDVLPHDRVDDVLCRDNAHRDVLHQGQALHDVPSRDGHDHSRRDVHRHDNALLRHDHALRDVLRHDRAGRGVPHHAVEEGDDFRGETFSQV